MQEINLTAKLSTGGSVPPVIDELSVTRNGTYTPGSGVDGFSPVIVDVPQQGVIESKTITENGTYTAGGGVDGFSPVVVNVEPNIESKTITENGTYTPGSGVDGFSPVIVDVPEAVLTSINIMTNGTYTPGSGIDGYNSITVNVPAGGNILTNCFNSSVSGSMGLTYSIDKIDITWNGGDQIVCTLSDIHDISSYTNLKVSFDTGTSYYNTYGAHVVRELYIGISETYVTPGTMPNNVTWVAYQHVHDDNYSYNFEWNLTELTTTAMYIYVSANGWNVSDLKIELS